MEHVVEHAMLPRLPPNLATPDEPWPTLFRTKSVDYFDRTVSVSGPDGQTLDVHLVCAVKTAEADYLIKLRWSLRLPMSMSPFTSFGSSLCTRNCDPGCTSSLRTPWTRRRQ